jgi:hypothetical protein
MSELNDQKLPWSLGPRASVTETPKTLVEEALEQVEGYTRRIIDLETRLANLEAALAKMEESK